MAVSAKALIERSDSASPAPLSRQNTDKCTCFSGKDVTIRARCDNQYVQGTLRRIGTRKHTGQPIKSVRPSRASVRQESNALRRKLQVAHEGIFIKQGKFPTARFSSSVGFNKQQCWRHYKAKALCLMKEREEEREGERERGRGGERAPRVMCHSNMT